jgi:c-di-GMP-binding flagellar brake protein YcgR
MHAVQQSVDVVVLGSGARVKGTIRHVDNTSIVIAVPETQSEVVGPGAAILITYSHEDGVLVMQTHVSATRDNGFLAPRNPPRFIQRRKQMRIPCDLKVTYSPHGAIGMKRNGHACDLSTGGMKMIVPEENPPGLELDIDLEFSHEEKFLARASVLRCVRRKESLWSQPTVPEFELAMKFAQVSRVGQIQLARFLRMFMPQG